MAPRKKSSNMVWVVKSKQPAKTTEVETEKNTSLLSDSVSKLQLSLKDQHTSSDWSNLPDELLRIISSKLEDCFDFIHARAVCSPWRSIFPFPSWLLRTSYSLPSFDRFGGFCTLEKFPVFLFRVRSPEDDDHALPSQFFVGGVGPDKSGDHMVTAPTSINVADCQIIPLGHRCRMVGYDPDSLSTGYRGVAILPLNNEEGGEFIVLIGYSHHMLALRSTEMRWMEVDNCSRADCIDIVTFRGKFYPVFTNGDVFAIDPYTLETTPLRPPQIAGCGRLNYLVPYGDDELYLVERIIVRNGVLSFANMACRVSVLDEEAGEWVVVSDLGDRVLLIGQLGNSSGNSACSAKELPEGCGVSGSSMLFINEMFHETFPYKYGVDTGSPEDDLNVWRCSRETRVTTLNKSPNKSPMVALRIERAEP
ncbi:PREDICTED: F-box/kelch-repeat protein At1g64840-like [Brassica oleracea var. oleracea]|uniref:F-box domain-containing protein n=1 Tax=Brassica oleracea var. oleracea TaxID=109376 RepID=A0A0D3C1W1_BRAOL|nr:PREDICTED: F-box/kelch-repeat protein At1g64840-like [Brassica oleracea var. oleracea]XP_013631675.1 PREDICTED: F-box/kelch-repeat protein At1g64840-like [Brassica oleracea var. oleracea]